MLTMMNRSNPHSNIPSPTRGSLGKLTSPRPSPSPQSTPKRKEEFGLWCVTKVSWATPPPNPNPNPPNPQLLSMKQASNKKTQCLKVTPNDTLYFLSNKNPGGKQEQEDDEYVAYAAMYICGRRYTSRTGAQVERQLNLASRSLRNKIPCNR